MDPMDILGGLLGGGSQQGSGGMGGKILTELLKGKRRGSPPPPASRSSGRGPRGGPVDIEQHANELEDLLGVAQDRFSRTTRPAPPREPPRRPPEPRAPEPTFRERDQAPSDRPFSFDDRSPIGRRDNLSQNEQAMVLIRAMIQSARADGRITQDEQQTIIDRLSNPSRDAVDFLRREFARSVDVREFAWSVPLGMEQKVYTMSLAAIDLDSQAESNYLRELAHGLRLDPELCNQIHRQCGAPPLY